LLASSCSFVLTRASRSCCSSDSFLLCRSTPRSRAACRACGVWGGQVSRRQCTRSRAASRGLSATRVHRRGGARWSACASPATPQ
jgi:hypothetical protein